MSGILKRTIYIGPGIDGYYRIGSWAKVITGIGTMWEPRGETMFANANNGNVQDFDWTDQMVMINDVKGLNPSGPSYGDGTMCGDTFPVSGY